MARALRPRTADCGPSTDTAYAPRARILECDSQSIPPPALVARAASLRDAEGQIRSCGASHFILVQRRAGERGVATDATDASVRLQRRVGRPHPCLRPGLAEYTVEHGCAAQSSLGEQR